ncbi:MAG: potassium transporter TrkG, partial [Thermoproteota archaeon]
TGGYSTRTSNVGAFNNLAVEVTLMIFMVMGATRFSLHHKLLTGNVKGFIKDPELRFFLLLITASSLIVSLDLTRAYGMGIPESLRVGFFHTISVGTTTGFTTLDLKFMPPLSKGILLSLMVVGGCMNSTAGGIKVWRFLAVLEAAKSEIEKTLMPPEAVKSLKIDGRVLKEEVALKITTFFFMYIAIGFTASLIMTSLEGDLLGSTSGVFSAMATVGPFYMSPLQLSPTSKVVLITCMWIGRLELIPVLILFMPRLWRMVHLKVRGLHEDLRESSLMLLYPRVSLNYRMVGRHLLRIR